MKNLIMSVNDIFKELDFNFIDVSDDINSNVILYSGNPICHKIYNAKRIANKLNVPFIYTSANEFTNIWIDTAKNVKKFFKMVRKTAPCIVCIDNIDYLHKNRYIPDDKTIDTFINELKSCMNNNKIVVLCSTNNPNNVSKYIMNAGVFNRHCAVSAVYIENAEKLHNYFNN